MKWIISALSLVTLCPFSALADEPPFTLLPQYISEQTQPVCRPFDQGMWTLDFAATYVTPIRYSENILAEATVGVGYYLFDNHSFNLRFSGLRIDQKGGGDDAIGSSIDILGRSHLLRFDDITLYIDGGGGRAWTDEATPPGGTTYNWIGRVGGGATWRIGEGTHLFGGARYFHLSNGSEHGRQKNPGYDGIEIYVGLMFTF